MGLFDGTYNPADSQGLTALSNALIQGGANRFGPPQSAATIFGNALNQGNAGFRSGMNTQALQQGLQAQNPQDMMAALATSQDPEVQKLLLANRLALMTPKYEITKDAMNNPIAYNSLNPNQSMRIGNDPLKSLDALNSGPPQTDTAPTGQPGWTNMLPGGSNSPAQIQQPTGVDYNYLNQAKQMAPLPASMAESMINGTFKQESGKGANDPNYVMALQIATRADKSFNQQALVGRPQMVENSTKGDMYKNETNLNTSMAHLYDLHQLAPLVNNSPNSSQPLNSLVQLGQTYLGGPAINGVNRYKSSLTTAAPEIAKYLGGGVATDTGTAEAQGSYAPTLPTATIQGNALDLGSKMMAKAGSLQHEYDSAMGSAASHKVANPMTNALFMDMQGKPLTPEQQTLVNQHRAESNLAPKTWAAKGPQSQRPILPPASAIAFLKSHPDQAQAFQAKYNIPASSFLGGQ